MNDDDRTLDALKAQLLKHIRALTILRGGWDDRLVNDLIAETRKLLQQERDGERSREKPS